MSSSDDKGKDIVILGERPTQGLDDTALTAEAKYPINFTQSYYNGSNSFAFVSARKIYQFKANDSEIKDYAPCVGNISKDFTINDMEKTGLKGVVKFFTVDFNPIDIVSIHKYLMKRT